MTGKITSLEEIGEKQDRPPNMLDYLLIEKCGEAIPEDKYEYRDLICSSKRTEELIDLLGIVKNQAEGKKIADLLVQDNVLYAVENSEAYQKKYGNELNIRDRDKLIKWVKENIKSSEDLEHLPPLTNDDIRRQELYPYGWWIPGKIPAKVFQSGGTTGDPAYIPYSKIDYEIACLIAAKGFKEYGEIKENSRALFLVPPDPHAFGPPCSHSLEKLRAISIWKHFRNLSTEQILDQIAKVEPDILIAAPHGPKGAAGALDVLLKKDQELGTEILPTYLENKKIVSGGAPISTELVEELYEDVGVERIVSGYGSANIIGYFGPIRRKREDGIKFFSEVEIPAGYWIVTPIEDEEAPEGWSRYGITVLGREIMPIIKFDHEDYGKVDLKRGKIEDICRKDWFVKREDGKYEVRIPSQVYTCISEV